MAEGAVRRIDLFSLVMESLQSFSWSGVRHDQPMSARRESVRNTVEYLLQINDPAEYDTLLATIRPEIRKEGREFDREAANGTQPPYRYVVYEKTLIICPLPARQPEQDAASN